MPIQTTLMNFIDQLRPATERDQIVKQLRGQIAEIESLHMPIMQQVIDTMGTTGNFKASINKDIASRFHRLITGNRNAPQVQIAAAITNLSVLLPQLLAMVERINSPVIAKDGVTFRTGLILQTVTNAGFYLKYAPKLIHYMLANESASLVSGISKEPLAPTEVTWLTTCMQDFIMLTAVLQRDPSVVIRAITSTPDTVADRDTYDAQRNRVDPLRLTLLPDSIDPWFKLGKLWGEWTYMRYEANKDLKKALERRLLELKMAQQNTANAENGARIKYEENRIQKLASNIAEFEKDINL